MSDSPLPLFAAYGVELEYMIVDAETLSVRPVTDKVIHAAVGEYLSEIERGAISWSNELALHVIELKTTGPADRLEPLPGLFQQNVRDINELLRPLGARLMPTAMHPWMDPHTEMRLWPHDYNAVYEAFNRIFDCRGHGWANLQSVHLNLPFADDAEFGRLHAAIRLVLPLLPALAASSPVMDGRVTGTLDNRLDVYRTNSRKIPSISGKVIPEPVFTRADYDREIFQRIYADIRPHDPEGTLQNEWLNARGAIARFDRNAIEIRVLDVQECPQADVAICAAITSVLRAITDERWTSTAEQQSFATEPLHAALLTTIRDSDAATIVDPRYLAQFGITDRAECTAGELWRHVLDSLGVLHRPDANGPSGPLTTILEEGPLARRIARALGEQPSRDRLHSVYGRLCDCLADGRMFTSRG